MASRFIFENQEKAIDVVEEIMKSERLKKVNSYIGNSFELNEVLNELYYMLETDALPKRTFKIPVVWEMSGIVTVEARSIEEALEIVKEDNDDIPLPPGSYIDGSFQPSTTDEGIITLYQKI